MKFSGITGQLQHDAIRVSSAQDNCRQLWQDKAGTIFSDLVLGDHKSSLTELEAVTGEAGVQQQKNEQVREEISKYLTEAQARDAALSAAASQIDGECDALEEKNRSFGPLHPLWERMNDFQRRKLADLQSRAEKHLHR